jgi:hypothetical protein
VCAGAEGLRHAGRAEEVDLDGGVEGRVEADGGGRVHRGSARVQQGPAFVVEAEAVDADVARDGDDAAADLLVEAVAPHLAQAVEAVVAQDLPAHPVGGGGAAPRAHQQDQLAAGNRAQQPLDQGGAEEPRRARDGDARACERLPNHPLCLPSGR